MRGAGIGPRELRQSGGRLDRHKGKTMKTGRNDPCPCGSGKKYKKCCGSVEAQMTAQYLAGCWHEAAHATVAQMLGFWTEMSSTGSTDGMTHKDDHHFTDDSNMLEDMTAITQHALRDGRERGPKEWLKSAVVSAAGIVAEVGFQNQECRDAAERGALGDWKELQSRLKFAGLRPSEKVVAWVIDAAVQMLRESKRAMHDLGLALADNRVMKDDEIAAICASAPRYDITLDEADGGAVMNLRKLAATGA